MTLDQPADPWLEQLTKLLVEAVRSSLPHLIIKQPTR